MWTNNELVEVELQAQVEVQVGLRAPGDPLLWAHNLDLTCA